MAEYSIDIYDGSPKTFSEIEASGSDPTPFGLYDADISASAPNFANYCAQNININKIFINNVQESFYVYTLK